MNNCNKIYSDSNCNIVVLEDFDFDYVYVYILQLNKSNGLISNRVIIKESDDQEVAFPTSVDGYYTLATLKIPLDESMPYYYKDGSFYKNYKEVELLEIIESNPITSKVIPTYDKYFCTCRLKKCYIKACEDIFDNSLKCFSNDEQEARYKRDLIWAALNVIQYMVENELYLEAQRLLDKIIGCNGLCPQQDTTSSNCGCGR